MLAFAPADGIIVPQNFSIKNFAPILDQQKYSSSFSIFVFRVYLFIYLFIKFFSLFPSPFFRWARGPFKFCR